MALNSRSKGKRGELELAAFLRERGFDGARRGRQFSGSQDSPDVLGIDGWHVECKRCEAGSLYSWLDQAAADAGINTPVVLHRKTRREWVAILRAEDLLRLLRGAP